MDEQLGRLIEHYETEHALEPRSRVGLTIWITGLSGAGKTTVATALAVHCKAAGEPSILLDGDRLRALLGVSGAHSLEERRQLAFRYAALCKAFNERGHDVICATISMFHDVRRWNRSHIRHYLEIYLRVPVEELRLRDVKGLYAASDTGVVRDLVGVDIVPEEPEAPDLVIDNFGTGSVADGMDRIWQLRLRRFGESL